MEFTELGFLMTSQFFMDYEKTNTKLTLGKQQAARDRVDALKQVSINNDLGYIAQHNINRKEITKYIPTPLEIVFAVPPPMKQFVIHNAPKTCLKDTDLL